MINSNEVKEYTAGLSILFVEDHQELRDEISDILGKLFKTVDSCVNGEEALKLYSEFNEKNSKNYDIVISDIQMPVMDGITLTQEIYKINPEQSIIILSAYDEVPYLLKLINLGIEQFIKKPIDYNQLLTSFINSAKKLQDNAPKKTNTQDVPFAKGVTYSKETKSINNLGESIYLTKFEIIFIELLISSLGKIYSNEEIVEHYATLNETIDASNIRKLVSKLRKKLPENSLESIYAIGYKFTPYND